jgi:hypothetical protein
MTHTEPDPEPGEYPTELHPDQVALPGGPDSGDELPADEELESTAPEYNPE